MGRGAMGIVERHQHVCFVFCLRRLVHGEDMNPAAAFVVDPDTQHLYTAYGRGNISQMERQKLMTGMNM